MTRKNIAGPLAKPTKTPRINRKRAFLAAFKESASITLAAKSAGIRREQHYKLIRFRWVCCRMCRGAVRGSATSLEACGAIFFGRFESTMLTEA